MTKILALLRGKNIISFVCMFVTVVVAVNIFNYFSVLAGLRLHGWQQFIWGYVLQSITLLAVLYFWFYRRYPLERKQISWQIKSIWQLIKYVVVIFISYFGLIVILQSLKLFLHLDTIPGLGEQISLIEIVGTGIGLWIAFLTAVVVAPSVEEYIFRGWGMICLPLEKHPYISIFLNGLLFALFHFELAVIIPLLFLGCMLAWVRYKSGSILPGIVFHLINNSLALLVDYSTHIQA